MKDKFGQFKLDFSRANSLKKEEPLFTQEQLNELYTDKEGETEQDQLEYAYWIKKFGNNKLLTPGDNISKNNNYEAEKEKALDRIKYIISDMKKEIRLSLIKDSGLNTFSDNQEYFSDFNKVLAIAKKLSLKNNSLGEELLSGLGSYRVLSTIEKRVKESDYKKIMEYFNDLERKGTLASLDITKSSRYLFIKEILNQAKEKNLV